MPVWLLVSDYGAKSFQVAVSGSSDKLAGEYPKSLWEVVMLVMLAVIVISIPGPRWQTRVRPPARNSLSRRRY